MTLPFPPTRPGPTMDALRQLLDAQRRKAEAEAKQRYGLPLDGEELPILDPSFSNTMLPTMRTTAEAPQAAEAGAARLMRPELQGTPAVTRRVPGVGETLADMAKQPAAAAAGLTARFGEGGARTIAGWLPEGSAMQQRLERAGDTIAEANRETQESLAPHSALAKMVRLPSELGVSALPYMAAGGGLLGLLRSAAMTGIESRATDGSLVEGLAKLTGSEALRELADSKYRTGADVGVDVLANLIPQLKPAMRAATRDVGHASTMAGLSERIRRNDRATLGADEWGQQQARLDARGVPAARQEMAAYGDTAERMPRARAVDEDFKKRVADWFEKAQSRPDDPEVVRAYRAFADETRKQFEHLQKQGVQVEFVDNPAPYPNSAEMMRDIAENNRLISYKTPETDFHPLLSPEENDMFRAVHDYFGHAGYGHQFGPLGEENAYRVHSAMYSPEARRAMATETRGQNSWVNTRPENKAKPGSVYAEQKVTTMPESLMGVYPSEQLVGTARGPLRDDAAVALAQLLGGARQVGRNVSGMARTGTQELRQNPRQVASLLALIGGEALAPGASAPFFMGSVMPVGAPKLSPDAAGLMGQTIVPVEAMPGSKWDAPTAEGLADTFPRTRALYAEEQLPTINPMLTELDKHFGGPVKLAGDIRFGMGSYEGKANVNAQVWLPEAIPVTTRAPKIDKTGQPVLAKNGEPIMVETTTPRVPTPLEKDATALGLAISQRQNAVPWMTPTRAAQREVQKLATLPADAAAEAAATAGLPETGMVVIPIPKAMGAGEAEHIAQVLQANGLPHSFTQVKGPTGSFLLFGNFTRWSDAPVSDAQMLRDVAGALNGDTIWERVAPGTVQPYYARSFGNYLGDSNEATHIDQLRGIAGQTDDPAAAGLARRLLDFLDRNTDRLRAGQEQVDRAYQPAAVFERGVADELRAGGVTPEPGLDAPFSARGLHPSLLERGDPAVPLLTPEGKIPKAPVPATTSGANIESSLRTIENAFAAVPNPALSAEDWKRWGSMMFGPVIPKRPTLAADLAATTETLRPLLARLDEQDTIGPAQMRSKMGRESDDGLKLGALFTEAYQQGTANPATSLMLYSWGSLSKRASVAPHETAFLDLYFAKHGDSLAPILERVARGEFTEADRERIRAIGKALPEGAFARQVVNNINSLADGLEKMAQPAVNARMMPDGRGGARPETNAERWHTLLADRSLSDEQFLREFQRSFADTAIGMDNKVVSFIGLVTGRRDLIVPDRVQLALQYNAPRDFANTSLSTNIYEKGGLAGLFKGAQGVAMQEAVQRGMRPSLDKLARALNRGGLDLGQLHWESWVASSDQEVGHGSLDVILQQARGKDTGRATSLVKEGQLDRFRYGEFQGVLNGERVFGMTTSDGRLFVMPREDYLELGKANKKLAPKGFAISENLRAPYWEAPGYPKENRDALIMQRGLEVPPPSQEAQLQGMMETVKGREQNALVSQMAGTAKKTPAGAAAPLQVFHATDADFSSPRAGTMFTTNRRYADDFADQMRSGGRAGRVREAELQIANPADLRALNMSPSDLKPADIERLKSMGYDGAQYRNEAYIIFDPAQARMLDVPPAPGAKQAPFASAKARNLRDQK